jgi:hypothetical protein
VEMFWSLCHLTASCTEDVCKCSNGLETSGKHMSGDLRLFFCQELGLVIVNIVGSGSFILLGFFLASTASSSSISFIRCSSVQ